MKYETFSSDLASLKEIEPFIKGYQAIEQSIKYLENRQESFSKKNDKIGITLVFPTAEYERCDNLLLQLSIEQTLKILIESLQQQKTFLVQKGMIFNESI